MLDVRFRPLTAPDAPLLREMLFLAIHVPPGEAPPDPAIVDRPELARYFTGWMQQPGDLGFVAESNGDVLGAAWVRLWRDDNRGYGFVDADTPELSLAVRADARGQGIGTRLVRHLIHEVGQLSLSVSLINPARRLYEREGFVPAGDPEEGSLTMLYTPARGS